MAAPPEHRPRCSQPHRIMRTHVCLTCAARSTNGDGRPAPTGPETCQLWGWGRNTNSELLQPIGKGTKASYSGPVEIKGAVLGGLDPADIRSIQGGTTGSASGIAVTCGWGAWLGQRCAQSNAPACPSPPFLSSHSHQRHGMHPLAGRATTHYLLAPPLHSFWGPMGMG
jgi:hypothetical protein